MRGEAKIEPGKPSVGSTGHNLVKENVSKYSMGRISTGHHVYTLGTEQLRNNALCIMDFKSERLFSL